MASCGFTDSKMLNRDVFNFEFHTALSEAESLVLQTLMLKTLRPKVLCRDNCEQSSLTPKPVPLGLVTGILGNMGWVVSGTDHTTSTQI